MPSIRTNPDEIAWTPWTEVFGDGAFYQGQPIIAAKTLSDRRAEGGGVAYLLRFSPPPGKLIKVVAVARSDEHVFNLTGGRATKSGQPASASGGYSLNPDGQPHSAMIASETVSLVIYSGETDEVGSVEIVDIEPGIGGRDVSGEPAVTLVAERDPQAEAVVEDGLAAFNREAFGRVDTRTLDVLVRDGSGDVVGGLLGHSSLGLFFLDLFYLPPMLRRSGLGGRIIAQAEDEARRRGCTAAFVYTVTFQAPGFYERHGYRRFGEIACPPDGATRIFLSKPLD